MENGDEKRQQKERMRQLFSDFMTMIAKFEELEKIGSRLLVGFQQALAFVGRPPINTTSPLVEKLIKAHGTRRFTSYIEAGCVNSHESVQNVSKLHTCHLGLQDHIGKAKTVVNELKCFLDNATSVMELAKEQDEDANHNLDLIISSNGDEEVPISDVSKPEIADYAAMMAMTYSMVKQDYEMQERIVSSLGLKSSSGELETYCQMWSLRPFVDDEIMHEAWRLVP